MAVLFWMTTTTFAFVPTTRLSSHDDYNPSSSFYSLEDPQSSSLHPRRLSMNLGLRAKEGSSSTASQAPNYTISSSSSSGAEGQPPLCAPVCIYHQVTIPTSQPGPPRQAVSVEDLTPIIQDLLSNQSNNMQQGVIHVISRHTTTAITINERESRLARDMAEFYLQLVPPDERSEAAAAVDGVRYLHNDIDQRPESAEEAQRCRDNGWAIDQDESILQAWRDQEPINAHSHLLSMLLGSSESIPVVDGSMVIGQWQSILLVDMDGPRDRTLGIQFMGYQ